MVEYCFHVAWVLYEETCGDAVAEVYAALREPEMVVAEAKQSSFQVLPRGAE